MDSPRQVARMLAALTAGTRATAFWKGVRDDAGVLVDLLLEEADQGFADWVGRPLAELAGHRYSEFLPTGIHSRLPFYLDALEAAEARQLTFDATPADRRAPTTVEVRVAPCGDDLLFAAVWDVDERESRNRELEAARAAAVEAVDLLHFALNSSPDGFAVYRRVADGTAGGALVVEFVNETAALPTGRAPREWVGAPLEGWFPEAESCGLLPVLLDVLGDKVPRRVVIATESPTGWAGRFENVVTPFGADRLIVEWWAEDADTPEGIEAPASMPAAYRRDVLTGLDNRGEFRRRLGEWIAGLAPGEPAGAVIVVDLDNFGRLNDLVGPQRADAALAAFAQALRALEPWLAIPARIGADACAALIPGPIGPESANLARAHANRILREVSDGLGLPPLSVSGGLRAIGPGMSADDILRDCDTALRHSVRAGGGRLTVFTPEIRADLLADYLVDEDIRAGLRADEFRLAYQPVVRIDTGAYVGDEALIRWHHAQHGELLPSRFIPIAESTGTIVALGEWVLNRALLDLASAGHDRSVGVNISGLQLLQSDVPAVVAAGLERHGLPAERVVVEITESAILPASARIRDQLAELRQMGVQVAIDDFGSGYSSIGYLDWIPVDVVKLDRSFVLGDLDRRRRTLIAATAQLIRSIGARSLAEGIETDEQWDVVREAGVDFGQGYMFGAPQLLADEEKPAEDT
jgi:diguanylate cyclase (GGDEF)-like protein